MEGSLLRRVLRGIAGLVRRVLLTLTTAAAIVAATAALVLPLWYLSSRRPRLYTAAALALVGALLLVLVVRRLATAVRRQGGALPFVRSRLLPALGRIGIVLAALILLYGIVLIAGYGYLAVAIPLAAVYLVGLAVLRYGRRRRR